MIIVHHVMTGRPPNGWAAHIAADAAKKVGMSDRQYRVSFTHSILLCTQDEGSGDRSWWVRLIRFADHVALAGYHCQDPVAVLAAVAACLEQLKIKD